MTSKKYSGFLFVDKTSESVFDAYSVEDHCVKYRVLHDGNQIITINDFRPTAIAALKKLMTQDMTTEAIDEFYKGFSTISEIEFLDDVENQFEINLFPSSNTDYSEFVFFFINRPIGSFDLSLPISYSAIFENQEKKSFSAIIVLEKQSTLNSISNQKNNQRKPTNILLSFHAIPKDTQIVGLLQPEYHSEIVSGFFYRSDDDYVSVLKNRCAKMSEIKPMLIPFGGVPLTFIIITIHDNSYIVWLNYFKNDDTKENFDYLTKQEILFFSVVGDSIKHDIYAKNNFREQFSEYREVLKKTKSISPLQYQLAQIKLMEKYKIDDLLNKNFENKNVFQKFFSKMIGGS